MNETNEAAFEEWGFWERLTRRKLRNYLFLDKKLQFNFALLLAVIGGVNALYFGLLFYFYTQESMMRLAWLVPDYALTEDLFQSEYQRFLYTIPFIGLFEIVLVVLLGLFFSHRIAGPLYNMGNKLHSIAGGKIPSTVRLRKNDLLTNFARHLNDAISALTSRRSELEAALEEINQGNTEACKARLLKLIEPTPAPASSSPHGGPPRDTGQISA